MNSSNRKKWLNIIERHEASGLNITQFCRQQQINSKTFYRYRNLFNLEKSAVEPQGFVKINPPELIEPELKLCTPAATMMLPNSVCPIKLIRPPIIKFPKDSYVIKVGCNLKIRLIIL